MAAFMPVQGTTLDTPATSDGESRSKSMPSTVSRVSTPFSANRCSGEIPDDLTHLAESQSIRGSSLACMISTLDTLDTLDSRENQHLGQPQSSRVARVRPDYLGQDCCP